MGALLSPLVWPTDPDASLAMRDGRLVGEVVGYVWHAGPNTTTIHVSSSLVGLRTFPVMVSAETRITDGDREGAFGDLRKHARVHLVYEAWPDGRLATSVTLLHGTAASRRGMRPPPRCHRRLQSTGWRSASSPTPGPRRCSPRACSRTT